MGRWWLPEAPEQAVEGILSHQAKERLILRLQGDVAPSRVTAWRFLERPILFGDVAGTPITLVGASTDFISFAQEYQVREAYLGGHFSEAPQFDRFSVALSDLDSFLGVNNAFALLRLKDFDEQGELLSVNTASATIEFVQDP